jgi:glycosyltransferase involved in cell wall biosynthesis
VKTSAKLAEGLSPQGIMIANLRPSKDIMLLLNALATIKDLPWRMKLVGLAADPQYAEECRKMLTDLCLSGRVEFVGPRVDVPELLKEADFAVLSSKTESGPLALIEYVAAELPFVSTRVGLVGRYLDSVGVTEFVAPEDIEQFSTALRRLLGLSPEERRARGQAGRRIAGGYFDIHQVIPAWYEVYNKALGAAS